VHTKPTEKLNVLKNIETQQQIQPGSSILCCCVL